MGNISYDGKEICSLYAHCGRKIQLPAFLLKFAWPGLAKILDQVFSHCHETTVDIILPDVNWKTLEIVKDLVTKGFSQAVKCDDETDVKNFLMTNLTGMYLEQFVEDPVKEESEFQYMVENVVFENTNNACTSVDNYHCSGMESLCSKLCSNSCHTIVQSWSDDDVAKLKGMFKCDKTIETKNKLLNHLKHQSLVGLCCLCYCQRPRILCEVLCLHHWLQ
jgi:hypothetical protein